MIAVLKTNIERPAILAVCALVPELPLLVPATHTHVGYGAAAIKAAPGATLTRSLQQEKAQAPITGTNGFAMQSTTDMDPVGGVRGIPPRGWPV
jgi:hypothetical protein